MSGVLHPKLGSIHSVAKLEVDDEPTLTATRPAPAYANDGPETTGAVDADDEVDDKPKPITWVRSRHPRLQH